MNEEYGNIADGFLLSQSEIGELRKSKRELTDYAKEKLRKLIYEQDIKKMEEATKDLVLNNLTQEQRQTIEDAFNSFPEDMRTGKYRTMEGIEEQLASGAKIIFYMNKEEDITEDDGKVSTHYVITKMKVGEE
jgi:hypothetical protein